MEKLINSLKKLGLSRYEAQAYIGLNKIITGQANEIAEISSIPRSRIYDILKGLEERGFVEVERGRPLKYKAIHPTTIISDEKETASSGAPVPKATMVRPMRSLLTLKLEATEEAPSTSQSAALIRSIKPIMSKMICNAISIFISLSFSLIITQCCQKKQMCAIMLLDASVAQFCLRSLWPSRRRQF